MGRAALAGDGGDSQGKQEPSRKSASPREARGRERLAPRRGLSGGEKAATQGEARERRRKVKPGHCLPAGKGPAHVCVCVLRNTLETEDVKGKQPKR